MTETIEYNGIKFRRYPNSTRRTDRVYFTPGIADKKRGVKRLHEEIWKTHNGEIPAGHHIHHKDGDPLNNDPTNLEALPRAEHMRHHHAGNASPALREHLERIRPKAAEWHRSPEGIAWHRQHAESTLRAIEKTTHTCEQCEATFATQPRGGQSAPRFCSNKCKSQWRRLAGLDNEDRQCAVCAATFTVNRYARKQTCGPTCAGQLISRAKLNSSTP